MSDADRGTHPIRQAPIIAGVAGGQPPETVSGTVFGG